jgi:hypothetical protein
MWGVAGFQASALKSLGMQAQGMLPASAGPSGHRGIFVETLSFHPAKLIPSQPSVELRAQIVSNSTAMTASARTLSG